MGGWLGLAVVVALFLAPLATLFATADVTHLQEVAASPSFPKVLLVTLGTGAVAAAFSVAIGFLMARPFAHYDWRGKRAMRLLALLPYLVPNFILATSYVISWNPGTGLLNGWLPFPGGLYGVVGMTVLFIVAHAPVALLMLEDKIARLDPAMTEAARLAGASQRTVAWRIELPLLRPALLGGFGLCFALNVSAFAIPAWIGAPERMYPLTYKIYQAIQVGGADGIPEAAAYSLYLFLLSLPILWLLGSASRKDRRYGTLSGKAGRSGDRRPPSRGRLARFVAAFGVYQGVTFVAPIVCLALTTVTMPGCLQQRGFGCFGELTLRSYHYVLFELRETRLGLWGSGVYGTLSALVLTVFAVFFLVTLHRDARKLRIAESIFTLLMSTPGAIIALGLIVSCSGRFGINLYNTPWIVVLAMLLKHQSLAFQPLRTGFANVGGALIEAARLAGASRAQLWGKIVLPILRPEIFGGFFLVLIPILGELTMSIFLASPGYRSLGTVLFDLQDYADNASAGALSILLLALILAANQTARWLTGGRVGY